MATTHARTIPVNDTVPIFTDIPDRPVTNTMDVNIRFLYLPLSTLESTRIRRPDAPIIPYKRNEIPPITGPGIVWIIIDNFPTNEQIIDRTAAPPITRTLYTFVTAITPIFSPYVVVGTDPISPDTIVEKLSPNRDL